MDLSGTEWTVVAIDGSPITGKADVAFSDDGLTASIQTACRTATTEYAWDTDGAALGIGPISLAPDTCTGEEARQDGQITKVLQTVESWRVIDQHHIDLLGAHQITLARPPGT
jgi:heat shock protein HslJ